jgi:hypothetical protein
MKVKCINNNGSKNLSIDKLYTVKYKKRLSFNMTLVNMKSSYDIDRFIKLDGTKIYQNETIINYHYILLKSEIDLSDIKFAILKESSKLKTLEKNRFYPILRFSNNTYNNIMYVNFLHNYHYYLTNNFIFYTQNDYNLLMRNKKIKSIQEKIKQY